MLTVQQLREQVRFFARNGGDASMYTDTDIDVALRYAADFLARETLITRRVDSLTLTAGTSALPTFPTGQAAFRPARLINAYLFGSNVQVSDNLESYSGPYYTQGVPTSTGEMSLDLDNALLLTDFATLLRAQTISGNNSQPVWMAFDTLTTGQVWPTPDQNYTVAFSWSDYFTVWTPGDETDTTLGLTTNIPDDVLYPALIYGAPAAMQHAEPEHVFVTPAWKQFLAEIHRLKREGTLGVRTIISSRNRR